MGAVKEKIFVGCLALGLVCSACVQNQLSPQTSGLGVVDNVSGTVLSAYPAFNGITPSEKEKIDSFIKRCPQENGVRVYFDPLYRGFYRDPTSNGADLPDECGTDTEPPFITPMAIPPFMPERLLNIYEALPSTVNITASKQDLEKAAQEIRANNGCAANNIESVRVLQDSLWVQVIVVSMDHYLDADPARFLSATDRDAIRDALDQGIPVTISPIYSCTIALNEWNWDGSEKR